ncbi:DUF4176 domain-containing protein [Streptococcus equinus]|uniref:DUF4176 domain-containing protein n=1 Tax=Streptococcus equinus TaxID=1335 RepID=UPI0008EA39CA|nr:DUF4176 domain-containing protein [Streptococcus equinus]SFC10880.1 hypothetical protein SAMN05216408_0999 [Streptococcus equinus]
MSTLLPIGSVVQLENGKVKLMIISRFPLYNNDGEIGYFDYSACLYPNGNVDNQAYFFNQENIEKVWFKGYIDENEEKLLQKFESERANIKYPRLELK